MRAAAGAHFDLRSLRARLTLSYATVTAILLAVIACGAVALAVQREIRSTMLAIDDVASRTRAIVNLAWLQTDAELSARVLAQPSIAGVHLRVDAERPPGMPPPPGAIAAPFEHAFGPPAAPPPERSLGAILGLRARIVWLHRGDVVIAPDLPIESVLGLGIGALCALLAGALVASWAIGRAIAQQAVLPLTTVTKELRRFAAGDFSPSILRTADQRELGALVTAFNGAAAQVVAAFDERERTERRLRLFLGEAGHEMRTPLTVISASLDIVEPPAAQPATLSPEMFAALRAETIRLRRLVERVLALARLEGTDRGRAEIVVVGDVARDAIDAVVAVAGGEVRLTAADDAVVRAEPWELEEAIRNLVDNAVRYGAGSPVDVVVAAAGGEVVVRVRDRGPGVSAPDRAQLFRHFFRGSAGAGTPGSGLGLAIVARAAERLGGSIELECADPRDTVFRLAIPACPALVDVAAPIRL